MRLNAFSSILALSLMLSVCAFAADKKVIDLGQLEIEGELRRPSLQWLDSQKRLKEWLPRIYAEQFKRLEDELVRPMTKPEFDHELVKEDRLVSN